MSSYSPVRRRRSEKSSKTSFLILGIALILASLLYFTACTYFLFTEDSGLVLLTALPVLLLLVAYFIWFGEKLAKHG